MLNKRQKALLELEGSMHVKLKGTENEAVIHESKFNEVLHEKISKKPVKEKKVKKEDKAADVEKVADSSKK